MRPYQHQSTRTTLLWSHSMDVGLNQSTYGHSGRGMSLLLRSSKITGIVGICETWKVCKIFTDTKDMCFATLIFLVWALVWLPQVVRNQKVLWETSGRKTNLSTEDNHPNFRWKTHLSALLLWWLRGIEPQMSVRLRSKGIEVTKPKLQRFEWW